MTEAATSERLSVPAAWSRWALRVVAAVGLVLSLWLTWPALTGSTMPGCGGANVGFTCDGLLFSRWARWFDVPVSALAALLYVAVLITSAYIVPGRPVRQQAVAFKALVALAVMSVGAAAWFGIAMWMERQACPYCLATHGCALLLAGLVAQCAAKRRAERRLQLASGKLLVNWAHVLAGLGGVLVLIVGQLLYVSPQVHITRIEGRPDIDTGPGPDRTITLLSRRIKNLRPHELPMLGSPDAPHLLVSLFDYTCEVCRDQHQDLLAALQRYGGDQLGIILLPVPLDSECNPLFPTTGSGSCYRTEASLALWRARPERFAALNQWLHADPVGRTAADWRKYLIELLGEEGYQAGMADPWVDDLIDKSVDVYSAVARVQHDAGVPLLLSGSMIIQGQEEESEELFKLLEQELGLVPLPGQPALPPASEEVEP